MTKEQERDAARVHQTEKRATADAQRETNRIDQASRRNEKPPAREPWTLPWDHSRRRP